MERVLDDPELQRPAVDMSRLAVTNAREIEEAQAYVDRLGTTDDFTASVGTLLGVAFRAWDDGGSVTQLGEGLVRVSVPARLRRELERQSIERATFQRLLAVTGQDEEAQDAPEFLSPGHPLVEAPLRRLRDEASDPAFVHRFDVEVGEPEGLVMSFIARFVDGDGRTVDERLLAVEVGPTDAASRDPDADLRRLGLNSLGNPGRPDPRLVTRWQERFPAVVEIGRQEAERRSEAHRQQLIEYAREMRDQEIGVLEVWRAQEARGIEVIALGTALQLSIEAVADYQRRTAALDSEYEARLALVRDRSAIRLASLELIGGRLIVRAAP